MSDATEFTCPKCGGHEFRSSGPAGYRRECKGTRSQHCSFEWDSNNDEKYFGPTVETLRERVAALTKELDVEKAKMSKVQPLAIIVERDWKPGMSEAILRLAEGVIGQPEPRSVLDLKPTGAPDAYLIRRDARLYVIERTHHSREFFECLPNDKLMLSSDFVIDLNAPNKVLKARVANVAYDEATGEMPPPEPIKPRAGGPPQEKCAVCQHGMLQQQHDDAVYTGTCGRCNGSGLDRIIQMGKGDVATGFVCLTANGTLWLRTLGYDQRTVWEKLS